MADAAELNTRSLWLRLSSCLPVSTPAFLSEPQCSRYTIREPVANVSRLVPETGNTGLVFVRKLGSGKKLREE